MCLRGGPTMFNQIFTLIFLFVALHYDENVLWKLKLIMLCRFEKWKTAECQTFLF